MEEKDLLQNSCGGFPYPVTTQGVRWKVLVAEIRTWMISFIKMHSFMQSSCWEKLIIFPQQEMTRRLFVFLR